MAPSARHASSTTDAATASPAPAAVNTSGAVMAAGPPATSLDSVDGSAAARSRAASAIPRPLAYTARHPRPPHQHGRPSNFTGAWPSSPPRPSAPRTRRPSSTTPAPNPVPGASTTSEPTPRPAPKKSSPSASALTSLSTKTGTPKRSRIMVASGSPPSSGTLSASSPIRPVAALTRAGTPTPMPVMRSRRLAAWELTAEIRLMSVWTALPRPAWWVGHRCSTSTSPVVVTTPAAVVVPPTSTPRTTSISVEPDPERQHRDRQHAEQTAHPVQPSPTHEERPSVAADVIAAEEPAIGGSDGDQGERDGCADGDAPDGPHRLPA